MDILFKLANKNTDILFLYLCGPSGTGKSTIARLFLEKYNYDVIEWNAIDLKQTKTIEEVFLKTLYKQNIQILVKEKNIFSAIIFLTSVSVRLTDVSERTTTHFLIIFTISETI